MNRQHAYEPKKAIPAPPPKPVIFVKDGVEKRARMTKHGCKIQVLVLENQEIYSKEFAGEFLAKNFYEQKVLIVGLIDGFSSETDGRLQATG